MPGGRAAAASDRATGPALKQSPVGVLGDGSSIGVKLCGHGYALSVHDGVVGQQSGVLSSKSGLKIGLSGLLEAKVLAKAVDLLLENSGLGTVLETDDQDLVHGVELDAVALVKLAQVLGDAEALLGHQVLKGSEVLELGQRVPSRGQHVHALQVHNGPEGLLVRNGHRPELVHGFVYRLLLLLAKLGVGVKLLAGLVLLVVLQNEEGAP